MEKVGAGWNETSKTTGKPSVRFQSIEKWSPNSFVDTFAKIHFWPNQDTEFCGLVNFEDLENLVYEVTEEERSCATQKKYFADQLGHRYAQPPAAGKLKRPTGHFQPDPNRFPVPPLPLPARPAGPPPVWSVGQAHPLDGSEYLSAVHTEEVPAQKPVEYDVVGVKAGNGTKEDSGYRPDPQHPSSLTPKT